MTFAKIWMVLSFSFGVLLCWYASRNYLEQYWLMCVVDLALAVWNFRTANNLYNLVKLNKEQENG